MGYEFERLPVPGFTKGNDATDPELMYSMQGYTQKGVTIAAGQGILPIGTVLGRKTSDKKYYVYNNGAATGVEVARGVLRKAVDTGVAGSGDQLANIVIRGILKNELVSGADAAALVDLNARVDTVIGTFTF
jgi:hypothetical protein